MHIDNIPAHSCLCQSADIFASQISSLPCLVPLLRYNGGLHTDAEMYHNMLVWFHSNDTNESIMCECK